MNGHGVPTAVLSAQFAGPLGEAYIALITPANAATEPTETSMPPVRQTNDVPIAITPITAT